MLNWRRVLGAWLLTLNAGACGGSAELGTPAGGAPAVGQAGVSGAGVSGAGASGAGASGAGASGGSGGAGLGGAGASGDTGLGKPCMYDELPRFVGVPFLCECNSCVCELDGTISATQIECKACSFLGNWYDAGESFLAQDGCNTCGCEADGNFGCTQIGCAGVEVPDYGRRFADKDPKACLLFDFACGLNTKHFSDETGCGCVQDRNCPQVIHCDGGIPNCVDGPIQCPFSKLE